MKEHIALFDMDGTLTPARNKVGHDISSALKDLTQYCKVGIVTGSGLNYILEQCAPIWEDAGGCAPEDIVLLPCNGTQYYEWKDGTWACVASENMRNYLGTENYDHVVRLILGVQNEHACSLAGGHPLTGNFISYRRSMVNWSPVGRDADSAQREEFVKFDHGGVHRTRLVNSLKLKLEGCNIPPLQMRLGGETSVDIYPVGWDKSFALDYFTENTCWFVGDKCTGMGNDKEIYEHLIIAGRAYQTSGPINTVNIIQQEIIPGIRRMK